MMGIRLWWVRGFERRKGEESCGKIEGSAEDDGRD